MNDVRVPIAITIPAALTTVAAADRGDAVDAAAAFDAVMAELSGAGAKPQPSRASGKDKLVPESTRGPVPDEGALLGRNMKAELVLSIDVVPVESTAVDGANPEFPAAAQTPDASRLVAELALPNLAIAGDTRREIEVGVGAETLAADTNSARPVDPRPALVAETIAVVARSQARSATEGVIANAPTATAQASPLALTTEPSLAPQTAGQRAASEPLVGEPLVALAPAEATRPGAGRGSHKNAPINTLFAQIDPVAVFEPALLRPEAASVAGASARVDAVLAQPAAQPGAVLQGQALLNPQSSILNPAATYSIAHGSIAAPVSHPHFRSEFAERVVFFAASRVQNAEIAVTPPELGPINVSIEMRGAEATLSFAAASPTARNAIEDALPRLREMFASHGLQLAEAHVGAEPRRDFGRHARPGGKEARNGESIHATQIAEISAPRVLAHARHLIDIIV